MRTDPKENATETVQLTGFVTYQRETLLLKTEGLTREQLARRLPSSSLTLAGLLYHLALVEESWSVERFAGEPAPEPWTGIDWDATPDWRKDPLPPTAHKLAAGPCRGPNRRTDDVVAATGDLDALSVATLGNGGHFSLRWMLLHLLEETSRHNGHADLLREAVDGVTGE